MVSSLGIQKDMGLDLHGTQSLVRGKSIDVQLRIAITKKSKNYSSNRAWHYVSRIFWMVPSIRMQLDARDKIPKGAWTVHLKKNAHKSLKTNHKTIDLTGSTKSSEVTMIFKWKFKDKKAFLCYMNLSS